MGTATLMLTKSGTEEHVWDAIPQASWLKFTTKSYDTIRTEADQLGLSINTTSLNAGTYQTNIMFGMLDSRNQGYTRVVPVTVTVLPGSGSITPPPPSTTPPPPSTTPPPPPPPPSSPLPIGGAGGVTPPPPPPTPTTASLSVSWTGNTEADLAGYRLYVGTSSGVYNQPIQVGKSTTSYVVTGLPKGQTYFIAVSAYDTTGNESQKSAEVSKSLF
jgi:hypothetical protein